MVDGSLGDWFRERVGAWGTVGRVAGRGHDAYARLLHPVPDDARPGAQPPRARWADVAAHHGTVLHPLAQWGLLTREGDPYAHGSSIGWLDPRVLAELMPLLMAHTSADDAVGAIWEGWGGLDLYLRTDEPLEVPDRSYILVRTSLTELTSPDWGEAWGIGWGYGIRRPSLQLLWPEDRAWVVASEIDWDSTIVAGSRALVDAVLDDERFETFEVHEGDRLSWDGDRINR